MDVGSLRVQTLPTLRMRRVMRQGQSRLSWLVGHHHGVLHLNGLKLFVPITMRNGLGGHVTMLIKCYLSETPLVVPSLGWYRRATVTLNDQTTTGWLIGGQRSVTLPCVWGRSDGTVKMMGNSPRVD
jgi:hypothetical protein